MSPSERSTCRASCATRNAHITAGVSARKQQAGLAKRASEQHAASSAQRRASGREQRKSDCSKEGPERANLANGALVADVRGAAVLQLRALHHTHNNEVRSAHTWDRARLGRARNGSQPHTQQRTPCFSKQANEQGLGTMTQLLSQVPSSRVVPGCCTSRAGACASSR
jgi:hypothetical protein